MEQVKIACHVRPARSVPAVAAQMVSLAQQLTETWFTPDVPDDLARDLLFHDALCLTVDGALRAFVTYTSQEGALLISLMGTDPAYRGQGYGTTLITRLAKDARALGFLRIEAYTVPPESKPAYADTVDFYLSRGFVVERTYPDFWQSGALRLVKHLK